MTARARADGVLHLRPEPDLSRGSSASAPTGGAGDDEAVGAGVEQGDRQPPRLRVVDGAVGWNGVTMAVRTRPSSIIRLSSASFDWFSKKSRIIISQVTAGAVRRIRTALRPAAGLRAASRADCDRCATSCDERARFPQAGRGTGARRAPAGARVPAIWVSAGLLIRWPQVPDGP